jgi:UDP-N-acetylmuramoyl-L-alanyl-D-glutamate--2,6-diaminopimelate ligase
MRRLRRFLLAPYHFAWAFLSAVWYGFPAKKLTVIGVTGTKGKSSVTEMLYQVLTDAGHSVAVAGTIRFAIGNETRPNKHKMTMPGRGFIQKFLAEAVAKSSTHAVIEITSEAVAQYRNRFLFLDALIFTNLQKEHIESHGSFENYAKAKLSIGRELAASPKRARAIIANADDEHSAPYLALPIEKRLPFSYKDAKNVSLGEKETTFTHEGTPFTLRFPGSFSVMNALAVTVASTFVGVPLENISRALAKIERIPGRTERIEEGQDFTAVVDYAHTPDSLTALYRAYPGRKICVLGNTGGGRDTWKRPEMGSIADEHCATVILTNEDPYDEHPEAIVAAMVKGMTRAPTIIMDRREAIRHALSEAKSGDVVLISGKGTDPFIIGPKGSRVPWSDALVVREELGTLLHGKI